MKLPENSMVERDIGEQRRSAATKARVDVSYDILP